MITLKMWDLSKYLIISFSIIFFSLNISKNYFQFAILSELCWLALYSIISIYAQQLDEVLIHSLPFIILALTAIEAVVIWSLVLINFNLK